jgi:hypothetical protein
VWCHAALPGMPTDAMMRVAGLAAVLAASLSMVSGLAVGAVPRSWQSAHDWVLLSGITAGLVLAAVAVDVVQARSPGGGERPGGPLVRVGTIRARTVQIAATGTVRRITRPPVTSPSAGPSTPTSPPCSELSRWPVLSDDSVRGRQAPR